MKATGTVSKRSRRQFLHLAATASALPAVSHLAHAQTYPSRPVNLIVFVPAGGNPDIIARLFAQALSQRLGQSVIIDNRPGGGGNLALQAVARAPADGHTLLLAASPHAINATLYEKSTITLHATSFRSPASATIFLFCSWIRHSRSKQFPSLLPMLKPTLAE